MISQKARYAFHALLALARTGPMVIPDIAAQERIPRKFLDHILLDLKHHGLVESRRGKFGGYGLRLAPDRISFGQVLRIIDGPIAPLACLSATAYRRCSDCKSEEACEIRRVFKVAESARDVLDRTTIADSLASSLLDDQLPKENLECGLPFLRRSCFYRRAEACQLLIPSLFAISVWSNTWIEKAPVRP